MPRNLKYVGTDPRHERLPGIPAANLEVENDDEADGLILSGLYESVGFLAPGTFYRRRPVDEDEDPDALTGKRWVADEPPAAAEDYGEPAGGEPPGEPTLPLAPDEGS